VSSSPEHQQTFNLTQPIITNESQPTTTLVSWQNHHDYYYVSRQTVTSPTSPLHARFTNPTGEVQL